MPFLGSAVVATAALLAWARHGDLLAKMADGGVTAALAVPFAAGPGSGFPASVRVAGPQPGDAGTGVARLRGMVTGVADALPADVLLVPADGVPHGLYLVDVAAEGVAKAPVISLDMTRQLCDLSFDDAPATLIASGAGRRAGRGRGAGRRRRHAGRRADRAGPAVPGHDRRVREGAQAVRPAGRVVPGPQAPAGRPVGVGHPGPRGVPVRGGVPGDRFDADARSRSRWPRPTARRSRCIAAQECVQMHGGIGFTWEHPAHLFLKRAKADSIGFGTADAHRAALASLVDLPAS